jgi:hypothetical protein
MTPQLQAMITALEAARFPYPVAFYPEIAWDLGPVLSIDAFDVPQALVLDVSDQLNDVLEPIGTEPMWLACAFGEAESEPQRSELPAETVWYLPRRTHAQMR